MSIRDAHGAIQSVQEVSGFQRRDASGKVEMLFLAAFHLIDACAAKKGQHINKHQNIRRELEARPVILGKRTDKVWRAFNKLQGDCRSRFVYGGKWTREDLEMALEAFDTIERLCLEVIG